MQQLQTVLTVIDQNIKQSCATLFDFVRFASVGTDPAYVGDCKNAADWLLAYLQGLGLHTSLHPTTGQPAVIGRTQRQGATAKPHILFYGHYDVQPAEPFNLWHSPPFEPRLGKGAHGQDVMFGRGTSDDKGQLLTFLEACKAWIKCHGELPFDLTVLLEGDEEGDTSHLDRFLAENSDAFSADVVFICDTEMWNRETPAITTSLRGCIADEITIHGPRIDLHSGYYGGPAVNPIKVLSAILAKMHDKNGRITIPGFYNGIKPVTEAQKRQWKSLKLKPSDYLGAVGLKHLAGEKGFSLLEQLWARPTAEVNGIYGGYRGAGAKTVLPATATAKLTFRLVQGQKPKSIRAAFRKFVKANLPTNCKVTFNEQGGDNTGIKVSENSTWVSAASRALEAEWNRKAMLIGSGASIPVVQSFKEHLGLDCLLVGFARDDDCIHSPNEKYDVESYHKGTRSWACLINEIAQGDLE
ncbi:MAG: M20/M25/M40 family metallo-hydrolase [Alphaproteobacteria bacterium]|nr:M20/M25/M40 family metallo-hydrolase [Alphaproteobacteria bacterium]